MNTVIAHCGCTTSAEFSTVHSSTGSATQAGNPKPRFTIPYNTRENGATFQDAKHGKGIRVHNLMGKDKDKGTKKRCTICAKITEHRAA